MNCFMSPTMPRQSKLVGILSLAVAFAACGGSIKGNGPDGATTTIPCGAMGACECMAASDRCAARTEACWCPSECNPQIACVCGGGQFLGCDDKAVVAACTTQLAAVQAKCANQSFVQYISDVCTSAGRPSCVTACLANLATGGSCTEIDCGFCPVCDCAQPAAPSPFAACLAACAPLPPPGLESH
jgi:hypothetical protein